ncbi:MAG: hypothetical protein OEY56_13275 [Cyclobacteriaceae bacterium]|nr:hypothetical protein [Cyclobacteriaceae bacterium]
MAFEEETTALYNFRMKLVTGEQIASEELVHLLNQFEDLIDMASVSAKIIDTLVKKHQNLSDY